MIKKNPRINNSLQQKIMRKYWTEFATMLNNLQINDTENWNSNEYQHYSSWIYFLMKVWRTNAYLEKYSNLFSLAIVEKQAIVQISIPQFTYQNSSAITYMRVFSMWLCSRMKKLPSQIRNYGSVIRISAEFTMVSRSKMSSSHI